MAYVEQIRTVGTISASQSTQNIAAVAIEDTDQFEGQSQIELTAQLLVEMRIMNQLLYELPNLIATGQNSKDPPESYRSEQSIFKI